MKFPRLCAILILPFLAGLAAPLLRGAPPQSGEIFEGAGGINIRFSLTGFVPGAIYLQGNASFGIIYQFWSGENSHPKDIIALAGEKFLTDPKAAETCLKTWTFLGLEAGKKYTLILNWQHMLGYYSMSIISDQMTLSVRLLKEFRYLPRGK